jgi:hypothetical protein
MKTLLRKFDAEENPLKKASMSGAVAREHNALEAMRRQAALLEMEIEASRPTPDPRRLAALLAAAGAAPTPSPVRFDLRFADASEIHATKTKNCKDYALLVDAAQNARDKLVRETTMARLLAEYPDGLPSLEDRERVRLQVSADLNLPALPAVEPDPYTDEQAARVARLLPTGD